MVSEMVENPTLESLRESIINLDFDGAERAVKEAIGKGISPLEAIESVRNAMKTVGDRFEKREYFLSELVVAGEIAKEAMKVIGPFIQRERVESRGTVILATVYGDIHSIGKDIVGVLLSAAGFEVIDLGVNVPAEEIVEAVRKNEPNILGLSALLTVTMVEMEVVIRELEKAGLREGLKVIVGGSPVTDEFAKKIGADHRAADAVEGVNKCLQWMTEKG